MAPQDLACGDLLRNDDFADEGRLHIVGDSGQNQPALPALPIPDKSKRASSSATFSFGKIHPLFRLIKSEQPVKVGGNSIS